MKWEAVKNAVVMCDGGTGYLVAPDLIVTCHHVVETKAIGATADVKFDEDLGLATDQATIISLDETNDCAVLQLSKPVHMTPLPLASYAFFQRKEEWECYGYPEITDVQGLPLEGQVRDVKGKDKTGAAAIILYAAQTQREKPHGFSGSPVLVQGQVIGHLKRLLNDDQGNAQMGILYACPFDRIRQQLPPGKVPNQKAPAPSIDDQSTATSYQELLANVEERYRHRYQHKMDERFELTLLVEDITAGDRTFPDSRDEQALEYILEKFQAAGRLLIIGSPGAGKTVLLLRLAEVLAQQAQADPDKAVPIIFNLASWTSEKTWHDWLQESFAAEYGVSKDYANQLLREKKITFLLDGLDELARDLSEAEAAERRAACMQSLNEYLSDGRLQVVICCRRQEFQRMQQTTATDAPVAVKVTVKDFTPEQINAALEQAIATDKNRYAAKHLQEALRGDSRKVFAEVLKTPFYFTTALEVFDNSNPKKVAGDKAETLKSELLHLYVEKKLNDANDSPRFSFAQTTQWLAWLARKLSKESQVTFELADLQPFDLRRRWLFNLLLGVEGGVVMGVLGSVLGGAIIGEVVGMMGGVVAGVVVGLAGSLVSGKIETAEVSSWTFRPLLTWRSWKNILVRAGIFGMVGGVVIGLVGGLVTNEEGFLFFKGGEAAIIGVYIGVFLGVVGGVFLGVVSGAIKECRQNSKFLQIHSAYHRLRAGIKFNMLQWGILLSVAGPVSFFVLSFSAGDGLDLEFLLPISLFGLLGAFIGILYTALFKHTLLRICLWIEAAMPLRYVEFLRCATDLRILEQSGGQWRFRHQHLQDYFAALAPLGQEVKR